MLLQFGANWCGWCHKLHGLFEEDKRIAEKLKSDYVEQGVQRLQDSEQAVLEREEKLAIRRFLAFAGYCFEVLMNEVRHIPPGEKGGKRVAGGMRARPETAGGIDHTLPKLQLRLTLTLSFYLKERIFWSDLGSFGERTPRTRKTHTLNPQRCTQREGRS